MENVPVTRPVPRLDLLAVTSSPKKGKARSKTSTRQIQRTLSSLNLTDEAEQSSEIAGRAPHSKQNKEQGDDSETTGRAKRANGTAGKSSSRKSERQLPSPPDSRTGRAGGDLFANASDEAEGSGATRKRSRTTQTSQTVESPNPKARKQVKTKTLAGVGESDADERDEQPAASPLKSRRKQATAATSKRNMRQEEEDTAVLATPARRTTRAAAKTEKPATRAKAAPKMTSTTASSVRVSRKRAPNGQRGRKLAPLSLDAMEPESDGEDPLLLAGPDTWVPVPWKPMFAGHSDNAEIKAEAEDLSFGSIEGVAESSGAKASEPAWEASLSSSPTPPAANEKQTGSSQSKRPIFPEFLTQEGTDDDDLTDVFGTGAARDPDSSFSGMDIDGDKPIHEFTVPLRTASPPSRRRRSSAVSQREETPGPLLENTPGKPRRSMNKQSLVNTDRTPGRLTSSSALMTSATPRAAPSASVPSIIRASPGPLNIAPATPAGFALRRSRTLSLSMSHKSPSKQTLMEDGTPAYPSPRYMGKDLGSLSPEKGRGPTRGRLPRLDEDEEESVVPLGRPIFEPEDVKDKAEGKDEDDVRPSSGPMEADDPEGDDDDNEEEHPANDHEQEQEPESHEQYDQFDQYEQEEEEDRRNSLRIERELTEDLSGGDEDEDNRMEEDTKPESDQLIPLVTSSSPAFVRMVDLEPKEEDDLNEHPSTRWNAAGSSSGPEIASVTLTGDEHTPTPNENLSSNNNPTSDSQWTAAQHATLTTEKEIVADEHPPDASTEPKASRLIVQEKTTPVDQLHLYDNMKDQQAGGEGIGFRIVHRVTGTTYDDGDSESDSDSDDDDGPPVVEITSKDPMVAARAAAILKLHHDYVEEEARKRRRRRSSAANLDFDPRSSPFVSATPPTRRSAGVPDTWQSAAATPVPADILRRAEREVSVSSPVHHRLPSLDPSTPQAGPSRLGGVSARYMTPIHGPIIPQIIIDPASSRPSEYDVRASSEAEEDLIPLVWSKADWKTLERCLLAERRELANDLGADEDQVDVASLNVDDVVQRFLNETGVDGSEDEGDWTMDKIRRRCQALIVRHTQHPSGSAPSGPIPGSPMMIPFSPAPSRQPTPMSLSVDDTASDQSTAQTVSVRRSETAVAPAVPLPPSLMAPRYSHLYGEAATIAGFAAPAEPITAKPTSTVSQMNDSPSPAPRLKPFITNNASTSRIPLAPSRLPRPAARKVSGPAPAIINPRTQMLPPPPPTRDRRTPPPVDTPSATSRVLGFLGLGKIMRLKPGPLAVAPAATAGQKRKAVTPQPAQVDDDDVDGHRLIRKRVQPTSPIAEELLRRSHSKDDLNHVEPEPPRPIPRPPHPKDLVSLSPVPPKETPSPTSPTRSRRSSGSSVKDLINCFETLEDKKDMERNRIRQIVKVGRRAVSGERSLRRVPSNLSTASVISAGDLEPSTPESRGRAGNSSSGAPNWSSSFQRDSSLASPL
ncbi:hypothetical protein FRB93_010191 [Tulasnella sp. JGI-2019a]|nr:hypothetical protein FRB93_010191 [Tulasnella sp. JGI-2019a]